MKFTEAQLEKAFAELLGNENFPHYLGETNLSEIPNSWNLSSFFANKLDI